MTSSAKGSSTAEISPSSRTPLLSLRGCHKQFPNGQTVLDDVSFDVFPGEIVTLIGPSGCGKSTLISCLAGLEPLTDGEVLLNGVRVTRPTGNCGVVFQEYGLFPWLTAYKNVEYGLRMQKWGNKQERDSRVRDYLKMVHLEEYADYYPRHMSGGMRQRLAIARALVVSPEVVLMDEPFAAVDAFTRRELQSELLSLWEQTGMTIVFITHNIQEAVLLGSRVVCLSPGPTRVSRIIEVGSSRPRNVDVPDDPVVVAAIKGAHEALFAGRT